jgi:ferritin-like metal-binding protein YciE
VSAIKTMHEAFLHELSDTYSAEHQLTEAMQGMLEMAQHPQVKEGLQQHIKETKQQIKNLDQVFKSLGEKPEDVTCKGAAGIISEFKSGAKEIKEPALLDGFIAAGGLKGEHYEIATYRCLVAKTQLMGHSDAMELLQENLDMEERFAEQLEQVDKQLGQELVSDMPELVGAAEGNGKSSKMSR